MTISPTSTAFSDLGNPTAGAPTPPKTALDGADFIKLLAVQFQSQDPLKPMEDTAFIAQMAQFTSLQQTSTMTAQLTRLLNAQDVSAANSYLGRQVTLEADATGATVSGVVDGVEMVGGAPRLVVDGLTYPVSSVLLVEPVRPPVVADPSVPPATP